MRDDPQLLSAMARLEKNNDFSKFKDLYLDSLLEEYTQHCVEAENPARVQGAAQVIQRIFTDLEEAEENFYKVTNQAEIPLG